MGVDGLTRENVASHLQKYRAYLRQLAGVGAADPIPSDMIGQVMPASVRILHP